MTETDLPYFTSQALWLRIAAAVFCGSLIGIDRQLRGKPAGIRTSILITLGTCMFITMGTTFDPERSDQLRILGQLITGIGFLGAGVIMSREGLVTGVTSASVIWVLATIGAAIGLGYYGMALAVTFITLGVLIGVELLEKSFYKLRQGAHSITQKNRHK